MELNRNQPKKKDLFLEMKQGQQPANAGLLVFFVVFFLIRDGIEFRLVFNAFITRRIIYGVISFFFTCASLFSFFLRLGKRGRPLMADGVSVSFLLFFFCFTFESDGFDEGRGMKTKKKALDRFSFVFFFNTEYK